MTPSEQLAVVREAIALMRMRAEVLPAGPWRWTYRSTIDVTENPGWLLPKWHGWDEVSSLSPVSNAEEEPTLDVLCIPYEQGIGKPMVLDHLASVDGDFLTAVADILQAHVDTVEELNHHMRSTDHHTNVNHRMLALAQAYLSRPPEVKDQE